MTKTLTEQWRDGELELNSLWFVRLPCGLYDECFYTGSTIFMKSISGHDEKIWQVLAPVPSYDHFSQLGKKVERLQEQLKEANEVIRFYKDTSLFEDKYNSPFNAIKYLKKWGVK